MSTSASRSVRALLAETGFVRSLARAALGRDEGSEDVVQDAWVAALEHGPREPAAARTWLYRVVRNRVASLQRREAVRRRHLARAVERAAVPTPEEILIREESRRRLVGCLLGLDPIYREPLVLRYYEDLEPREIARRLDLPTETVRTRLRRGIERLRRALDEGPGGRRAWVLGLLPLERLPGGPGAGAAAGASGALAGLGAKAVAASLVLVALAAALGSSAPWGRGAGRRPGGEAFATAEIASQPPLLGAFAEHRPGGERGLADDPSSPGRRDLLTLTVLDHAGAPVVGATVRVAERRADFPFDRLATEGPTDAQGRFSMPRTATPPPAAGVPHAAFVLFVRRPPERDDLQDLEVPGWRPEEATVTLARGFAISGVVVDREGAPVPGARVHLEDGPLARHADVDAGGRFRFDGLPAGRWRTRVALCRVADASPDEAWTLDSGSHGVRLAVSAGRRLLVRVAGHDPAEGASRRRALHVTAYDADGEQASRGVQHPLGADGTLWLHGLEEGLRYALWSGPDARGRIAYAPDVGAHDGERTLPLCEGLALRLDVVRPAGWRGWPRVEALARGVAIDGRWIAEESCVLDGLPDEDLLVRARGTDADGRRVTGQMRTRPGGRATLVLSLD